MVLRTQKGVRSALLLTSLDIHALGRHGEAAPRTSTSFSESRYKEPELPQRTFLTQSHGLNKIIVTLRISN